MTKKELLNLPKLGLVKEIIETAAKDKRKLKQLSQGYSHRIYEYKEYYRAKVIDDVLKVAIYQRDDIIRKKPSYLIFISKEKRKFLTYDTLEEKWRTAKIDRLNGLWGLWNYYSQKRYYCKGTEKEIVDYLDNEKKTGYEAIYFFQESIRNDQLKRRHRRITDEIDSKMELVPELPKDFNRHVENRALLHSRYIYYEYSRKIEEGYCTYCKKDVKLNTQPKYNQEGTCPECRSKIIYKTAKRAGKVVDKGYASILQKTREGFVLRYFDITKRYYDYMKPEINDYKKPEINTGELIRKFYDKNFNLTDEYEYTYFKNTNVLRWCNRDRYANSYSYMSNKLCEEQSTLYTRNLKTILKGTSHQYSAIEIFAKNIHQFYPSKYIKKYKEDKFIEYLVKAGLYNITYDYIHGYWTSGLNRHGKRIHDVLNIKKSQIKALCKIDPTIVELATLQDANEQNVIITPSQYKKFTKFKCDGLLRYMKIKTPHKIIRYVTEQNKKLKEDIYVTARFFHDYLQMKRQLGEDLDNDFIFFPKDLTSAHDRAVEEINNRKESERKKKEEERNKMLREIAKELKHYKMQDKNYTICIPSSTEDFKKEGNELHHCLVSYIDTVVSRESIILFVRETKEVDKPFFTLEIKNNKVNQLRGKYNCKATPEVEKFVEKFKKRKLYRHPERRAV